MVRTLRGRAYAPVNQAVRPPMTDMVDENQAIPAIVRSRWAPANSLLLRKGADPITLAAMVSATRPGNT